MKIELGFLFLLLLALFAILSGSVNADISYGYPHWEKICSHPDIQAQTCLDDTTDITNFMNVYIKANDNNGHDWTFTATPKDEDIGTKYTTADMKNLKDTVKITKIDTAKGKASIKTGFDNIKNGTSFDITGAQLGDTVSFGYGTETYILASNILNIYNDSNFGTCSIRNYTFNQLWIEDNNQSLTLLANTSATATMTLTTQVKPADNLALRLNITVSGLSLAGTVTINGNDAYGNNITETNATVLADGTYNTTNYYAYINNITTTGTFGISVSQPHIGIIAKWGDAFYSVYGRLNFTADTCFNDSYVSVKFERNTQITTAGVALINIGNNARFRCGIPIDALNHSSRAGCTFYDNSTNSSYYHFFISLSTYATGSPSVEFYSTNFYSYAGSPDGLVSIGINGKVWNVGFFGNSQISSGIHLSTCGNCDIYNLIADSTATSLRSSSGNISKVSSLNNQYAVWFQNGAANVSDVYARGCSYAARSDYSGTTRYDNYMINPDIDYWHFTYFGNNASGLIWRQYTVDLTVKDKSGNAINAANVSLFNGTNATIFMVFTNSTGQIPQQIVTRGTYTNITGDTLADNGPHTLNITLPTYINYTQQIIFDAKKVYAVVLLSQSDIINTTSYNVTNSTITTQQIWEYASRNLTDYNQTSMNAFQTATAFTIATILNRLADIGSALNTITSQVGSLNRYIPSNSDDPIKGLGLSSLQIVGLLGASSAGLYFLASMNSKPSSSQEDEDIEDEFIGSEDEE
jgi:hypothetical protein